MDREVIPDISPTATSRAPAGYLDYTLIFLEESQRIWLLAVLFVVVLLSLVGNVATIVVNVRRPIRPFFRTCLLSLAAADLISTIFQSLVYAAQLVSPYTPIWTLGSFLCLTVPFLTTAAIIVNSFALVAIALDRYMAVGKWWALPLRAWEPGLVGCLVLAAGMWLTAAAISFPSLQRYELVSNVFVIETNPANRSELIDIRPVQMCVSMKEPNATYYSIVFGVIYLPLMAIFLWLNGVIAMEIWRRRKPLRSPASAAGGQQSCSAKRATNGSSVAMVNAACLAEPDEMDDQSTGKRTTFTGVNTSDCSTKCNNPSQSQTPPATASRPSLAHQRQSRSSREIRQLRMFRVILCIMLAFLVFRLPTWCYLLYKLQNTANQPAHWVLHYSLGILSLANCVLNPLLYTFLAETIDGSFAVWDRVRALWRRISGQCRGCGCRKAEENVMLQEGCSAAKPMPFYCSEDRKEKLARVD